ncbi:MAG: 6-pyruvoyl-tetrahydropterin synthase-related protein [Anaerolineales bacterium]
MKKWNERLWAFTPLILLALTLGLYAPLLFSAGLPWGSDTLGHLMKVTYLNQQVRAGNFYPNLFPGWYLGIQLFRYYPPLPYYLLLPLYWLSGLAAASYFVAACAWLGSLTLLPFARWMGRPAAFLAAALFLIAPDHLRVALAEGNLPRALATTLFPLTLYFLLRLLESPARRWELLLALAFTLTVLTHAMMAAIAAVTLGLVAVLGWAFGAASLKNMFTALTWIALGMALAAFWLLPSLQGGITGLDARAMTEALAVIPLAQFLTPNLRENIEGIYLGAALLLSALPLLALARPRPTFAPALLLTGMLVTAITLPGVNAIFNSLPLSNLLWPLRFLGAASTLLILSSLWLAALLPGKWRWPLLLVFALIALDFSPSTRLIFLRPLDASLAEAVTRLKQSPGWRVAVLDESRLGSAPTYLLSAQAGREQVFGWAYQGAHTARNVAALNDALTQGHDEYLLSRLNLYGVDSVLTLTESPLPLETAGFTRQDFPRLTLYTRPGAPRAAILPARALGIGRGAQNLAYLFPGLTLGGSALVDEYPLDELTRYQTVFLSGFGWNKQSAAESLLRQAASAGVEIVVDLTGTPPDPLAQIPHFLDVWGEPIFLDAAPLALSNGESLPGLGNSGQLWHAIVPQGLPVEQITVPYLGQTAALWGYQPIGAGKIWFIGFNLIYFAAQTRDAQTIALLREILPPALTEFSPPAFTPLQNYRADANGYAFDVFLERDALILIPVAAHDGFFVSENGERLPAFALENLVALRLPAGNHALKIAFAPTGIYYTGAFISLLAWLGLMVLLRRRVEK